MSQNGKTIRSFGELKEAFAGLRLKTEEIPEEMLQDPSRLDEVVEMKFEEIGKIQMNITEMLNWLATVVVWLALCQDPMKRRIAKQEIAPQQAQVRAALDELLTSKEPIYRTSAAMAYLNFKFGEQFSTHDEAEAMLKDLEGKKLLIPKGNGPIMIGYNRYDVSPEFGLEPEDLKEVQTAVAKFARGFLSLVKQQRQEKSEDLAEQATMSLDNFRDGIQGKFLLTVPAERYEQDGQERWRGGGNLLLEVNGKDVMPLSASGSIEKMVQAMVDMGVKLPHYCLTWDMPPGAGKGFAKLQHGVMDSMRISERDAEMYVRKMQSLWYLVTRGMDSKDREEEMNALRDEYVAKETTSPEFFFGLTDGVLPGHDGVCFLEFEGSFKFKGVTYYDMFFLVERTRNEGKTFIQVLNAPEHVKQILGELSFQKNEELEDFVTLPPALQKTLRAIRKKTDMKSEIASNGEVT